jgi:phage baseplate assembly protein gpV
MAENANAIDALLAMVQSQLMDVNTALPGVIQSYANGMARVLPTAKKRYADGDVLDFPVVPNVRVLWPSFAGGTAGIKGPVKAGDKCLLIFAQQAVDGSDDRRTHDLQDAFCVMCDIGRAGPGDSGNNDDLTVYHGNAYMRLTAGGKLLINAPGGTEIVTPTMLTKAATSVRFETPITSTSMALTTEGLFTYRAGMSGYGSSSAATVIRGNIEHTGGSIKSLGRRIDGTHTHPYTDNSVPLTTSKPNT